MAETVRALELGCPYLRSYSPLRWDEMEDNEDILDIINGSAVNKGIIPEAIILIGTLPTIGNTVVIGVETWTFVAAAASTYQVTRGATPATAIAALVAKINANTALLIKASAIATGVKIQYATAANGTPVVGASTSYALSETLTDAADVWNQDNLNATGQTNHLFQTITGIECTAENLATVFTLPLAFTVTTLYYRIVDADGLPAPSCTAKAEIVATGVQVTFNDGGSPAVATNVIVIQAYGSVLL